MAKRTWRRVLEREHNGKAVRVNNYGYVLVWEPNHPKAFRGWYFEHRVVMEAALSRRLRSDEDVHHINGDKADNRPDNLKVMDHLAHKLLTAKEISTKRKQDQVELAAYRNLYGPLKNN